MGIRIIRENVMEYLKALVVLVVMAIPLAFIVNCSPFAGEDEASIKKFMVAWEAAGPKSSIDDSENSAAGDQITIALTLLRLADESAVDLSWMPPESASDFHFDTLQPTNPGGPPPFLFSGVVLRESAPDTSDLIIRYSPPSVGGDFVFVETFVATFASGGQEAFSRSHLNGALPRAADISRADKVDQPKIAEGIGWRWANWFFENDPDDLERSKAEELIEYLQSGKFFIGLRFPVRQEADVLEYDLPMVMSPGSESHIAILDHSMPWNGSDLGQAAAVLVLEYDPARQEFLENRLPKKDATRWAALRPSQTPIDILDRFPIPATAWEFFATGVFDLRDMPNYCLECVPEFFFCHEGQDPPPLLDDFFGSVMTTVLSKALASYQGEGVTCIGPAPVRLANTSSDVTTNPPFTFDGPGFDTVTGPAQVELFHDMWTTGSSPVSVVFEIDSSMGLDWGLYEGDFEHADLNRPINGPLTLNPDDYVPVWTVGDVPAEANGAETITLTARTAGDASQSTWTTTNLWIGDWVPPEGNDWTGWIPVVSHAAGAQGSSWRSDLGLLNRGSAEVNATITLHAQSGPQSVTQMVPAGAQLILEDIVDSFNFSGSAALEISAPSQLVLSSRTYSVVGPSADCFAEGSLGQNLAGYESAQSLSAGNSALIPQLQENSAYRTNVAVINTGEAQASVRVNLINGSGTQLATYDVDLTPGQWKQDNRPFFNRAGQSDMAVGFVRIEVLSGAGIVAYGSVVDNITNDPTTMAMVTSTGAANSWIPVASHASGAQGSSWRSDLGLLNTGTATVDATVILHTSQGPVTLTRSIAAGSQVILADVVDQMDFVGSGALEVTATASLIVTSRTYSQIASTDDCYADGTLGQSLESTAAGNGLGTGQSAVIPQLRENAAFRSNVAVINIGDSPADVRVHLFDGADNEVDVYSVNLDQGQWKQENRPFFNRAGLDDLDAGYAMIEVVSGSGIVAYGSVVDNTTNDPTTMPMIQ